MKVNLLAVSALAAALAMPLGASAQQSQYPASTQSGNGMPSQARLQHRWTRRLAHLNLSGDQQQRIQSLITQYSQAHPEGSPIQPGAGQDLRRQIMGVLNTDQQNQLHQEMRARRAQMEQRNSQQQGGQDQQNPDQQYQQGPPNQQQPPDQQQQGPPGQQGGPPDQGSPNQQGPPNQGPPPG
jgi:hypothetical protein